MAYWAEPSPTAHHRPVGMGELHADRRRQPEAQAAPGAEEVAAGTVEADAVAHGQGGRGRLQDDDGVVGDDVGQRGDGGRRAYRILLVGRLGPRALLGDRTTIGLAHLLEQGGHGEPDVGHDGVVGTGGGAAGDRARRVEGNGGRVLELAVPVVHGNRHEDRTQRRQGGQVDGAGQRQRDVLGPRWLVAELHQRIGACAPRRDLSGWPAGSSGSGSADRR